MCSNSASNKDSLFESVNKLLGREVSEVWRQGMGLQGRERSVAGGAEGSGNSQVLSGHHCIGLVSRSIDPESCRATAEDSTAVVEGGGGGMTLFGSALTRLSGRQGMIMGGGEDVSGV